MLILGAITITLLVIVFVSYNLYFMKIFREHEKEEEAKRIEKLTKFYNNIKTDTDEHIHS